MSKKIWSETEQRLYGVFIPVGIKDYNSKLEENTHEVLLFIEFKITKNKYSRNKHLIEIATIASDLGKMGYDARSVIIRKYARHYRIAVALIKVKKCRHNALIGFVDGTKECQLCGEVIK